MDKELVEKITKLVLERMGLTQTQTGNTVPLSDVEILEWSSLSLSKPIDSKSRAGKGLYAIPLSEDEVEDWAQQSQLYSFSRGSVVTKELSMDANKVKFTKYC